MRAQPSIANWKFAESVYFQSYKKSTFNQRYFGGVIMCRTSIYEARNNLSNFVKIAEGGEPVELTRYDKPVAVIISYEEYEKKSSSEGPSWLSKWREKYADVLSDEGIPLPPKVYPDPNRVIFEE